MSAFTKCWLVLRMGSLMRVSGLEWQIPYPKIIFFFVETCIKHHVIHSTCVRAKKIMNSFQVDFRFSSGWGSGFRKPQWHLTANYIFSYSEFVIYRRERPEMTSSSKTRFWPPPPLVIFRHLSDRSTSPLRHPSS